MKVNQLTFKVAYEMATGSKWMLNEFNEKAQPGLEVIYIATYNFIYPLINGHCTFHKIDTCCKVCGKMTDRNKYGIGAHWLRSPDTNGRMDILCTKCRQTVKVKVFGQRNQEPVQLNLLLK